MLNSNPDALIIFVRPIGLTNNNPDFSFCINSVNIQFNNHAGLCTNTTQADLWRTSVENGIHQSWEEFSGNMMGYSKPFKTVSQAFPNLDGSLANIAAGGAGAVQYAQ